jgi:hypothetical protein
MSGFRSFASLSSTLLARKGQAKPAMRPYGFTPADGEQDDLGWNDMGQPPAPEVHRQRVDLAEQLGVAIEADAGAPLVLAVKPERPAPARAKRARPGAKGRLAFTLRLDRERHMRLREACVREHRSAQAIMTEILDTFLMQAAESASRGRK